MSRSISREESRTPRTTQMPHRISIHRRARGCCAPRSSTATRTDTVSSAQVAMWKRVRTPMSPTMIQCSHEGSPTTANLLSASPLRRRT